MAWCGVVNDSLHAMNHIDMMLPSDRDICPAGVVCGVLNSHYHVLLNHVHSQSSCKISALDINHPLRPSLAESELAERRS